jgi:hypothetical protein
MIILQFSPWIPYSPVFVAHSFALLISSSLLFLLFFQLSANSFSGHNLMRSAYHFKQNFIAFVFVSDSDSSHLFFKVKPSLLYKMFLVAWFSLISLVCSVFKSVFVIC